MDPLACRNVGWVQHDLCLPMVWFPILVTGITLHQIRSIRYRICALHSAFLLILIGRNWFWSIHVSSDDSGPHLFVGLELSNCAPILQRHIVSSVS